MTDLQNKIDIEILEGTVEIEVMIEETVHEATETIEIIIVIAKIVGIQIETERIVKTIEVDHNHNHEFLLKQTTKLDNTQTKVNCKTCNH